MAFLSYIALEKHSEKTGPRKGELERMVSLGGETDT